MIHWAIVGFVLGAALAGAVGWLIARRQIDHARRAERRARAAERLAEIGSMTSGLAHEIRNPLSTIALNAELLREAVTELDADPDQRARLERRLAALQRETERLRDILEDFLHYAGQIHIDPVPTDLNRLVDELIDFFQPQADAHAVRIRAQLADQPLIARVDVPRLKQALLNLLLNAVQAMQDTDTPRELILRTRRDAARTPPAAVIHVIDTGPGIPDDLRDRIFQPYFTTKAAGTGLGLATSRRIVDAHQGDLEVYSKQGAGTEFRIVLPLDDA